MSYSDLPINLIFILKSGYDFCKTMFEVLYKNYGGGSVKLSVAQSFSLYLSKVGCYFEVVSPEWRLGKVRENGYKYLKK